MTADINAADDVHVHASTQDEINQADLCVATQNEINFAELRYEGSLLQEAFPERVLKIRLPTTAEPDIVVIFGRQTADAPAHQLFVTVRSFSW
jgi:MoxR-like ATPase